MNNNTTILLAVVCAALAAIYFVSRDKVSSSPDATPALPMSPGDQTSHHLLDDDAKTGDVVRVEIHRKGNETLVFEKDKDSTTGLTSWHMTAPINMKVRSYEAEGFGRNVNNLQYQISYKPGDPGAVTEIDAGLKPPLGRITIEDKDGKKVTVEVGKRVSKTQRYVRLAGDDRICLAKSDLFASLKSNLVQYRDQSLWSFAPADATRIQITQQAGGEAPLHYEFLKKDGQWKMTSPVSAKTTDKVEEMVSAVSHLRVAKWEADAGDRLAAYGLDPSSLTLEITVEQKVPVETTEKPDDKDSAEDNPDKPQPTETKTETHTYVLHVSDRSPIEEDTKTFLCVGDETMVATVMKTTVEKLKPVMDEWRDMRITTADVDTASRITIDVGGEAAAFTKGKGGTWKFESGGGNVEPSQITELLAALKSLKAVAFVETNAAELNRFGLAQPRATVTVAVPGLESPLRIAVGKYTDAKAKRLVYLRKNDAPSIAKVRTRDVDALLKKPLLYHDHTIFKFDSDAVTSVQLTRTSPTNDDPSIAVTFERKGNTWKMTQPVEDDADPSKLDELIDALSKLRARAVVASSDEKTAFGLHAPVIKVIVDLSPEKDDQTQTVAIAATEHDGKFYLQRNEQSPIYEIEPKDYARLDGEFRSTKLCAANNDDVTALTITLQGDEQSLTRMDGKWIYQSEPDLPLDQKKVDDLLNQIVDLHASRYVRQTDGDLARFGLDRPSRTLKLSLKNGSTWQLKASAQPQNGENPADFFATTPSHHGIVTIPATAINRISVNLDDLEAE